MSVRALLGEEVPTDPRAAAHEVPLLVCDECGDLGCGGVTATITATEAVVTWSDFRWVGAGDPDPEDTIDTLGKAVMFERSQYRSVLERAMADMAELAK